MLVCAAVIDAVEKVQGVAKELGCTTAQLALAWTVANKNVSTAIFGASSMGQLQDNLGCLEVLPKLTPAVMATLDDALGNRPTGGPDRAYRTTASKL